jgi:hypothetical protein
MIITYDGGGGDVELYAQETRELYGGRLSG